jgi:hypothetical protein
MSVSNHFTFGTEDVGNGAMDDKFQSVGPDKR